MSSFPQASAPTVLPREHVGQMSTEERIVLESLERSAVTLEQYAEELILHAESYGEVARREQATKRRGILRDDWARYLLATVKNWLRPEVYKQVVGEHEDQADISKNPAKQIWSELAVAYKRPAVRRTRKSADNGERYKALLEGTDFDGFWQRVEIALEAYNDLLIWPVVTTDDAGKKVIKHRMAAPDMVSVRTAKNDGTQLEAVLLIDNWKDQSNTAHKSYDFWTKDWYATFDENHERTDIGERPGENPYGQMPFVELHREPCEEKFWNSSAGEDLVCLTLLIGRNRTVDHFTRKMSGFTQLMAWGDQLDDIPEQLRSEVAILKFTLGNGGVREVTWSANLTERYELNERDISAAAASRGINPEKMKRAGVYQNTTAARLGESGLAERRQNKLGGLCAAEAAYYRKVCVVAAANGLPGVPDPDDVLETEHAPLEYPEDPLALVTVFKEYVALGIESNVTLVQKLRPSWDLARCREWLLARANETAEVRKVLPENDITNRSSAPGEQAPAARDGQPPSGSPTGQPPRGGGRKEDQA